MGGTVLTGHHTLPFSGEKNPIFSHDVPYLNDWLQEKALEYEEEIAQFSVNDMDFSRYEKTEPKTPLWERFKRFFTR